MVELGGFEPEANQGGPSISACRCDSGAIPINRRALYSFTVFYELMRTRIDGKIIARHELGMGRFVRGVLTVSETWVPELARHSRVATFSAPDVHDLYDATLLHTTSEGLLVLTGFEHRTDLPGRPVDFAQTWMLRISGDQSRPRTMEAIMESAKETPVGKGWLKPERRYETQS
jgi:hypothetical protein